MVRRHTEYEQAALRLAKQQERLREHEATLRDMGLGRQAIDRAMAPLHSFHLGLAAEVEHYERAKRGELAEVENLRGLGRALVDVRIAASMTQRDLAERLGVHESQVSRDERNEYRGVTVERASRILDALGATLVSRFENIGAAAARDPIRANAQAPRRGALRAKTLRRSEGRRRNSV